MRLVTGVDQSIVEHSIRPVKPDVADRETTP